MLEFCNLYLIHTHTEYVTVKVQSNSTKYLDQRIQYQTNTITLAYAISLSWSLLKLCKTYVYPREA